MTSVCTFVIIAHTEVFSDSVIKERIIINYKKPQATPISTNNLCDYGCGSVAKFEFANKKKCCSKHHNSCQGKRDEFSRRDHSERTAKSLATRIRLGITKSSQIKGSETRRLQGHYEKLARTMQRHWDENPWQNNLRCPLVPYKGTMLNYQGSYEYKFLEELEEKYNVEWIVEHVSRGPSLWYIDPVTNIKRLYISDFIITDTIYEIKSHWSWNNIDKNEELELKNKAKLQQCLREGYKVKLILDGNEVEWA